MHFWTKLFDTSDFPARWHCGNWTDAHGWLHVLSDIGVWSAYFAIPCILGYFSMRRKDLPFRGVFLLFGAFILLCGMTHLMEAIIFWWPAYRLAGLIKLLTAVVSWATVVALIQVAPVAMSMRAPEELEREIAGRKIAEEELQRANAELERRVQERTAELVETNAALGIQHEWFRTTLASIGDGVITTDTLGRVTVLNKVAESLTLWSQQQAAGQPLTSVFQIVNAGSREPVENPALRALELGSVVGLANHTILIAKDGSEKFIDDSAAPIVNDQGETLGTVLIFRDISQRYETERARRELAARLNTLVQNAPIGIALFDTELRFVDLNEPAAAVDGLPLQDHLGKTIADLLPGPGTIIEGYLQQVRDTGQPIIDVEIMGIRPAASNQSRHWIASYYPVRDEQDSLLGIGAITLEITDRKRAEQSLRYQYDLTKAITDNATTAIFMMDDQSRCTFMNPAAETMTGFRFEEASGRILHDLVHHTRPDGSRYPLAGSLIDRALPEKSEVHDHEDLFVRKNGEFFPVLCNARPIYNDGVNVGTVIEVLDITQMKRTEEELRRIAAQLADADRRKDEFLATLAHELRNPLAPIRTGLEIMRLSKDDPVAMEETRRIMERQTQQLIALVDDLLDVSRITRGKLELRKCQVNLSDVVQSAVEASRSFIEEAHHEFTLMMPDQPILLDADPHRLAQVLSNLLNNAAKYTPKGGRLSLSAQRQGSDVLICVKDNGIGIPADMADHIFEMFAQIDRPMEKNCPGLGIGLTLVKSLVQMHGGTIKLLSEGIDQGSEFQLRLPILVASTSEPPLPVALEQRAVEHAMAGPTRRVLVVDDNQAAAETLSKIIRLLGGEVRTAKDGQEAVKMAATFLPDVILMDLGMPKMNGYQAAEYIRQQPWGENVLLVALTGWGQDEDKRRTKQAGFDQHLVKPAEPAELQRLLWRVGTGLDSCAEDA